MSEPDARSVLEKLADFSHGLTPGKIPAVVRTEAVLCILDTLGCMAAGSVTADAKRVRAAEASGGAGASVVVGAADRLPPAAAARVNGYAGDVFEVNDLIGGHASIGVVSAALALARPDMAGEALVCSVAAGVEVTARLYNTFYPSLKSYETCGMVSVGLPSAVGAAAAAARLLGLPRNQTREALTIAAALAGWCPAEVIFGNGGTVKPMLFGASPAATALSAVLYAQAGLTGPPAIVESRIGYAATMSTGFDRQAIAPPEWALARPRRKMHACCGYIHSALDAVVALRKARPDAVAAATAITVELPAYIMPAVGKSRPPMSAHDARFHAGYCISVAAGGADVIVPAHTEGFTATMADDRHRAVMQSVALATSDRFTHYHQSRVTVRDDAGRCWSQEVTAPRGSDGDPLSVAELIAKFDALAAPAFGADVEPLRNQILALDGAGTLATMLSRLGAGPSRGQTGQD